MESPHLPPLPDTTPVWLATAVGVAGWALSRFGPSALRAASTWADRRAAGKLRGVLSGMAAAQRASTVLKSLLEHDTTVVRAVLLSGRGDPWVVSVVALEGRPPEQAWPTGPVSGAYMQAVVEPLRKSKGSVWLPVDGAPRDLAAQYTGAGSHIGSRVYWIGGDGAAMVYLSLHCRAEHSVAPVVREGCIALLRDGLREARTD